MFHFIVLICFCRILFVSPNAEMYTIKYLNDESDKEFECSNITSKKHEQKTRLSESYVVSHQTDPLTKYRELVNAFLFGQEFKEKNIEEDKIKTLQDSEKELIHYPNGNIMRSELFFNQKGVHLPNAKLMHRGHCRLMITRDHMQTAVNAFAILTEGDMRDLLNLPSDYVLRSARTISMMKLPREKLAAIWTVVKNGRHPIEIPYSTLEKFRPLFKYVNGKEIARLNLSDNRILSYIGTHADLGRHQVGVVASKYIKLNPNWMEPKYLNLMNNLLCGVPMTYMRKLPPNTYLQLSHQVVSDTAHIFATVFYHITACDPLQRRFYLAIMTKTQALGKSFSWSAHDVSHLGLLLAEVDGPDLGAMNPAAMSGISAHVMLKMPAHTLQYITEPQLRYLGDRQLTILAKKLNQYLH